MTSGSSEHRDRSRRFARLLHSLIDDPRFNRLALDLRGAWVSLLVYQDSIYPACLHRGSVMVGALLGPEADRYIDDLVGVEMLDDLGGGEFSVHGIDGFHVRSPSPSDAPERIRERVAQHRQRKKEAAQAAVTDVTDATDVSDRRDETIRDETRRDERIAPAPATNGAAGPNLIGLQLLAEELTQVPNVLVNLNGKMGDMVKQQVRGHGIERVGQVWRDVADDVGGYPTIRQIVLGADDRLNPIPSAPRLSEADRQKAERDEILRRVQNGGKI